MRQFRVISIARRLGFSSKAIAVFGDNKTCIGLASGVDFGGTSAGETLRTGICMRIFLTTRYDFGARKYT